MRRPANHGLSHSGRARHLKTEVHLKVHTALHVAGLWRYPVKSLAGEPLDGRDADARGHPGRPHRARARSRGRSHVAPAPSAAGASRDAGRRRRAAHRRSSVGQPGGPGTRHGRRGRRRVARSVRGSRAVRHPAAARRDRWRGGGVRARHPAPAPEHSHRRRRGHGRNAAGQARTCTSPTRWCGSTSLRGRCPMTTVDPDTLERDPEVLKDIGRRFGGQACARCRRRPRRDHPRLEMTFSSTGLRHESPDEIPVNSRFVPGTSIGAIPTLCS